MLLEQLRPWAKKRGARVVYDMALRWSDEDRRIGVNPDISVLFPNPPEADGHLKVSYCTWEEGKAPPILAIEVVSVSNAEKDYSTAPMKYAASGTKELVVFDPEMVGPHDVGGGPFRLQV